MRAWFGSASLRLGLRSFGELVASQGARRVPITQQMHTRAHTSGARRLRCELRSLIAAARVRRLLGFFVRFEFAFRVYSFAQYFALADLRLAICSSRNLNKEANFSLSSSVMLRNEELRSFVASLCAAAVSKFAVCSPLVCCLFCEQKSTQFHFSISASF